MTHSKTIAFTIALILLLSGAVFLSKDLGTGEKLRYDSYFTLERSHNFQKYHDWFNFSFGQPGCDNKIIYLFLMENLHWADQFAAKVIKEKGDKDIYTVAAGITPSGSRQVVICAHGCPHSSSSPPTLALSTTSVSE